jgi:hypothetical protein
MKTIAIFQGSTNSRIQLDAISVSGDGNDLTRLDHLIFCCSSSNNYNFLLRHQAEPRLATG